MGAAGDTAASSIRATAGAAVACGHRCHPPLARWQSKRLPRRPSATGRDKLVEPGYRGADRRTSADVGLAPTCHCEGESSADKYLCNFTFIIIFNDKTRLFT